MALNPGTKLGPYEILSQIGAVIRAATVGERDNPSRDREGAGTRC